jgi:hypothetical protein
MTSEDESLKQNETSLIAGPKNLMRRPFPLVWGLVALALFAAFAVVTQVQFNRINGEKFQEASQAAYENALQAYEVAVEAREDCIQSIQIRETYKDIFGGIEHMFKTTADLPVKLIPDSEIAAIYKETLTADIDRYITDPVAEGLPTILVADCPLVPADKPERP